MQGLVLKVHDDKLHYKYFVFNIADEEKERGLVIIQCQEKCMELHQGVLKFRVADDKCTTKTVTGRST